MAGEVQTWKKFAEQARGGELYPGNEAVVRECLAACDARLTEVIKDHMETVENMREVMAQSIKHLTGQDVAAGRIAATDTAGR